MVSNMNLLKTISLPELTNWSVRYLLDFTFNYNEDFELVSIGEFLTRNRNIINIQDEITYSRVTVSGNNNGVRLRDTEIGKNIGTKKQYLVKSGQFIISKIDARNGALGIIPDDLEGAIVTNDFPTFFIDNTRINSLFLLLITTTKTFINFAQSCSSGTTNRQRINIEQFLNIKIPLPSLKEQDKIVAQYNKKIVLAEKQENEAIQLESEIENYLFDVLGIEKLVEEKNKKGLQLVSFKNLNVWATWNVNTALKSTLFPSTPLGNILDLKSGTFLPKKSQINGKHIVYGGNGFSGYHNKFIHTGNRIIIGRVGEYCGNVHLVTGEYWVTDNAFYTEKINDEFDLNYLKIVLKFIDLNRFRVISAQPSISQKNITNVPVPLAPFKTQLEIVNHISILKNQISDLKKRVKKNELSAITEFEQEIFKPV